MSLAALKIRLFGGNANPIGLHFGPSELQLAQFDHNTQAARACRGAVCSLNFDRSDLLENAAVASKLIRKALVDFGFSGTRVISAMPPDSVRVLSLSYPDKAGDPGQQIMKLMSERLDGPLEDYVIDYMPIRETSRDGEKLALVAVSERRKVMAYLDLLSAAGLRADRLEIGPVAIRRVIQTLSTESESCSTLAINVGLDASFLSMISGQRLLSDQRIDFCETHLLETVATTLDISVAAAKALIMEHGLDPVVHQEAAVLDVERIATSETLAQILKPEFVQLARDANNAFVYADSEKHGGDERRIYLLGSISKWPGVLAMLRQCTQIPIDDLVSVTNQKFMPAAAAEDNPHAAANLIIATGLALYTGDSHA